MLWLDPRQMLAHLRQAPLWVLALALALFLGLHVLGAFKLHLLLNIEPLGLSFLDTLQCYLFGLSGNLLLPSAVGGDMVVLALALRKTRRRGGVLFALLVHRSMDLAAVLALAAVGVASIPRYHAMAMPILWAFIAAGAAAVVMVALAASAVLRGRLPFRWKRRQVRLRRLLLSGARQPGRLAAAAGIALGTQSCLFLINAWLAKSVALDLPWSVWFFALPLAKIVSMAPVTLGGIGARELALATLLGLFNVNQNLAVAASLLWQGVVIAGCISAGVLAALLGGMEGRKQRS